MKTKVNGKEINLYDKNVIGAEFTNVVNGYLQNGFVFDYSESTRGTQGEELRVNLTNDGGNTVYVVYLDRQSYGEFGRYSLLKIIIERFDDANDESTLWFGKGEVVSEKAFYCISDFYKNAVFVDNEDDFGAISKISKERKCRNRNLAKDFHVLPLSANKIAFKILKKMKGYKKVSIKDIEYVVHRPGKCFAVKLVEPSYLINLIV